jgi:hypothetical protein
MQYTAEDMIEMISRKRMPSSYTITIESDNCFVTKEVEKETTIICDFDNLHTEAIFAWLLEELRCNVINDACH